MADHDGHGIKGNQVQPLQCSDTKQCHIAHTDTAHQLKEVNNGAVKGKFLIFLDGSSIS